VCTDVENISLVNLPAFHPKLVFASVNKVCVINDLTGSQGHDEHNYFLLEGIFISM
jgi:hypothetical protein